MITHEITNPPKQAAPEKGSRFRAILQGRKAAQAAADALVSNPGTGQKYMDKIEYAKWIGNIQKRFPIGHKCTLASLSYIPGTCPVPLYAVVDVPEVHWSAPLDDMFNEPRCVFVVSDRVATVPVSYSPKMLRSLNEEELKIAHLRNKKPAANLAGPGEAITLVANEWCLVAISTGEILKKYS